MRSFSRCLPNHEWMVHRWFPDADFYLSTVEDKDSIRCADTFAGKWTNHKAHDKQPDFPLPLGCPSQWSGPQSFYMHEPYAISVAPSAVLGQLWQLQNVWRLMKDPDQYDCFIRVRPDIWFQESHAPGEMIFPRFCHTPWWGRFGGLNDRFAIMGLEAATAYFTTFSRINELISDGCPLHPESLLLASLQRAGCFNKANLRWVFGTLRTTGELRHPEITGVDIAHARFKD